MLRMEKVVDFHKCVAFIRLYLSSDLPSMLVFVDHQEMAGEKNMNLVKTVYLYVYMYFSFVN